MTNEELDVPSYLIVKRGCYYRPNERGYTSSAIQAGRYTLTEAEKITHPNGVDGPRDGMTFIHEDEVNDEDWKAYTTLRAQLAEAQDRLAHEMASLDGADRRSARLGNLLQDANTRADRAEAALAAPEVMHEDAPAAIVGEIGNQIHNLGCELQNDEDVSLRLSELACRCWDVAKLFPTDRTALDRMLAEAREKALREAIEAYPKGIEAIIALIEDPNAR